MVAIFLRALGFLRAVPWQVWLALALGAAVLLHLRSDRAALRKADAAGYSRAMNEIETKARALAAKADALASRIRTKADEDARHIADRADDLRLRGPGAARCSYAPPAAPASRREPSGGAGDAARAPMPADERAAVPWDWLVAQAERCDLNRNEVLSWREWHQKLLEVR